MVLEVHYSNPNIIYACIYVQTHGHFHILITKRNHFSIHHFDLTHIKKVEINMHVLATELGFINLK